MNAWPWGVAMLAVILLGACGSDESAPPIAPGSTSATVTAASTAPTTTPPTAPATAPGVAQVNAVLAPTPGFEVLYEAGVGAAPDQLGLEDCTECDPTRPLSPMRTSGDRLVIADVENRRWVAVDEGRPATEPMPADLVAWDAVMGPGDIVYLAAFTQTPSGPGNAELLAFDAADLGTVVARWSIPSRGQGMLRFDGEEVVLLSGPRQEERFPLVRPAPDPMPTVEVGTKAGEPQLAVTAPDGSTTAWVLEPASLADAVPLDDGAVAVSGVVENGGWSWAVWTLHPDGRSAGQAVATRTDSYNGRLSMSESGIISLERTPGGWRVIRFPLPVPNEP